MHGPGALTAAGGFFGTASFDEGTALTSSTDDPFGASVFVASYDEGSVVWALAVGGRLPSSATSVTETASGPCITGGFAGSIDFDPAESSEALLASAGGDDIFVACYAR